MTTTGLIHKMYTLGIEARLLSDSVIGMTTHDQLDVSDKDRQMYLEVARRTALRMKRLLDED